MKIQYIGGPNDGEFSEQPEELPAHIMIPKGSNLQFTLAFIEGKPLMIPHYELAIDVKTAKHIYIWTEPIKN